jgi:hypothetical protein
MNMAVDGVLSPEQFGRLLSLLREDGYRLVGPTVREGAIGELRGGRRHVLLRVHGDRALGGPWIRSGADGAD